MRFAPKYQALIDEVQRRGTAEVGPLRLCLQLLTLTTAIDADCATRLAPLGLSEGKFVMLFLLHSQGGQLSPHQLADRAGVTRATVTGLLDGLERDGFLTRHRGQDDRRMIAVHLTEKGTQVAQDLFTHHTAWITTLFAGLSQADQQVLGRLAERVWMNTDIGRAST
jgi:DNA-binding MarR family transcriptional regulator